MIEIQTFCLGPLQTNAYLLTNSTQTRGIVIDPGANPDTLLKAISSIKIEAILLTHAHFDHIAGVELLRKKADCPVYVHEKEQDWLMDPSLNGSARWPNITPLIKVNPAEYILTSEQTLSFLDVPFQVLHTPGHSPGSVTFIQDSYVFSGDVIFQGGGSGRTDLIGGDAKQIIRSIYNKLFRLPGHYRVYPGHGISTTIEEECIKHGRKEKGE